MDSYDKLEAAAESAATLQKRLDALRAQERQAEKSLLDSERRLTYNRTLLNDLSGSAAELVKLQQDLSDLLTHLRQSSTRTSSYATLDSMSK